MVLRQLQRGDEGQERQGGQQTLSWGMIDNEGSSQAWRFRALHSRGRLFWTGDQSTYQETEYTKGWGELR